MFHPFKSVVGQLVESHCVCVIVYIQHIICEKTASLDDEKGKKQLTVNNKNNKIHMIHSKRGCWLLPWLGVHCRTLYTGFLDFLSSLHRTAECRADQQKLIEPYRCTKSQAVVIVCQTKPITVVPCHGDELAILPLHSFNPISVHWNCGWFTIVVYHVVMQRQLQHQCCGFLHYNTTLVGYMGLTVTWQAILCAVFVFLQFCVLCCFAQVQTS